MNHHTYKIAFLQSFYSGENRTNYPPTYHFHGAFMVENKLP